jgi:hypothetical protein
MQYLMHTLAMTIPIVALAVVGLVLLRRHRTIAAALAALGFSTAGVSQFVSALVGYLSFDPGDFVVSAQRFGWILNVTHWGLGLGLWTGSLGLLWHTLRSPRST